VNGGTFATTFLASAVEAIEMVTIVIGVGVIRGWRSTLIGAATGFVVLVAVGGGLEEVDAEDGGETRLGLDWTAFVLAFKGVLLEGLEIAFIVVTFGAAAQHLWAGAIGGGSALVAIGGLGALFHRSLTAIPRSVLILVVGLLLTTFGAFWSTEGVGVHWPSGDRALLVLLAFYAAAATGFVLLQRRAALGPTEKAPA
jgi:uncharacterized membrane protein